MECIAKNNNCSQNSSFIDGGVDFYRLLDASGADFLIFAALKTGLKINGFSGWFRIQTSLAARLNNAQAGTMIVEKHTVS